jgi:(p)ppGpp synthase/HD superfamily hydrolase
MSTLERAIVIATEAHAGQLDKGGQPYILHPLRVMLRLKTDEERIVAVLHDVLEDTEVSSSDLYNEGFSIEILEALDDVTKRENESYIDFILRIKNNKLSTSVKIADIQDNMDLSRIPNPTEKDYDRNRKYRNSLDVLER